MILGRVKMPKNFNACVFVARNTFATLHCAFFNSHFSGWLISSRFNSYIGDVPNSLVHRENDLITSTSLGTFILYHLPKIQKTCFFARFKGTRGCRFVPKKHFRKQSATDGFSVDLDIPRPSALKAPASTKCVTKVEERREAEVG